MSTLWLRTAWSDPCCKEQIILSQFRKGHTLSNSVKDSLDMRALAEMRAKKKISDEIQKVMNALYFVLNEQLSDYDHFFKLKIWTFQEFKSNSQCETEKGKHMPQTHAWHLFWNAVWPLETLDASGHTVPQNCQKPPRDCGISGKSQVARTSGNCPLTSNSVNGCVLAKTFFEFDKDPLRNSLCCTCVHLANKPLTLKLRLIQTNYLVYILMTLAVKKRIWRNILQPIDLVIPCDLPDPGRTSIETRWAMLYLHLTLDIASSG